MDFTLSALFNQRKRIFHIDWQCYFLFFVLEFRYENHFNQNFSQSLERGKNFFLPSLQPYLGLNVTHVPTKTYFYSNREKSNFIFVLTGRKSEEIESWGFAQGLRFMGHARI